MGTYRKHWVTASSKKAACGRRKANVITTVRPGEVTCALCSLAIALLTLLVLMRLWVQR